MMNWPDALVSVVLIVCASIVALAYISKRY